MTQMRMLRLAVGGQSQLCEVANNFKVVVIVEDSERKRLDLPFLNRFERQLVRPRDVLSKRCRPLLETLHQWMAGAIAETGLPASAVFPSIHAETLPSAVLRALAYNDAPMPEESAWAETAVKLWMARLATPVAVLYSPRLADALGGADAYFATQCTLCNVLRSFVLAAPVVGSDVAVQVPNEEEEEEEDGKTATAGNVILVAVAAQAAASASPVDASDAAQSDSVASKTTAVPASTNSSSIVRNTTGSSSGDGGTDTTSTTATDTATGTATTTSSMSAAQATTAATATVTAAETATDTGTASTKTSDVPQTRAAPRPLRPSGHMSVVTTPCSLGELSLDGLQPVLAECNAVCSLHRVGDFGSERDLATTFSTFFHSRAPVSTSGTGPLASDSASRATPAAAESGSSALDADVSLLLMQCDSLVARAEVIRHAMWICYQERLRATASLGDAAVASCRVVFLLHLPPSVKSRARHFPLSMATGWDYYYCDEVAAEQEPSVRNLVQMSITELSDSGLLHMPDVLRRRSALAWSRCHVGALLAPVSAEAGITAAADLQPGASTARVTPERVSSNAMIDTTMSTTTAPTSCPPGDAMGKGGGQLVKLRQWQSLLSWKPFLALVCRLVVAVLSESYVQATGTDNSTGACLYPTLGHSSISRSCCF